MLRTKRGELIMEQLAKLNEADVEYHTQVVLCPGLNDGEELDRTIQDIISMQPYAKTLGIVPVGLTKIREKSSSKYVIGKKKCVNKQVRILFI